MNPWLQAIFFGSMILTGMAVAVFVGMVVVSGANGISFEEALNVAGRPSSDAGFQANIVVNGLNQLIAFGGAALLFGALFGRARLDGMGLRKPTGPVWAWLGLAAVGTLSATPVLDLTHRLNQWLMGALPESVRALADHYEGLAAETTEALLTRPGMGAMWAVLAAVAVLPGLCEELAFRSVFQPIFVRSTRRLHLGIWLGAAVFSAIHVQFHGFLPRMVIGAGLGYLVVWSGSIWPAVMAHFVNNAGTVVQAKVFGAEWIRQEMNASGPWEVQDFGIAALCAVGLGVSWWAMRRLANWAEAGERYVHRIHWPLSDCRNARAMSRSSGVVILMLWALPGTSSTGWPAAS